MVLAHGDCPFLMVADCPPFGRDYRVLTRLCLLNDLFHFILVQQKVVLLVSEAVQQESIESGQVLDHFRVLIAHIF